MRETGPVRRRNVVTPAEARQVGLARTLLGSVRNLMRLGGIETLLKTFRLAGGITIRVGSTIGDHRLIDIDVPEPAPLPLPTAICKMAHGFLKFSAYFDEAVHWLAERVPPDKPGDASTFSAFAPSEHLSPAFAAGGSDYPQCLPRMTLATSLGYSTAFKQSGKFSGEMRKVVQLLGGLGVPIRYSYTACLTHGVSVDSDGRRWLVEISSVGLRMKPLKICRDLDSEEMADLGIDIPYIPGEEVDLFEKNAEGEYVSGEVFDALGPSHMAPLQTMSAMYPSCGWAFSADGRTAANVFYEVASDYVRTYLYTIRINPDTHSANISLEESALAHGDRITHPKFPDENEGRLISFDLYRGKLAPPGLPASAPVHVFFIGNEMCVCRHHPGFGSTTTSSDNMDYPRYGGGLYPYYERDLGEKESVTVTTFGVPKLTVSCGSAGECDEAYYKDGTHYSFSWTKWGSLEEPAWWACSWLPWGGGWCIIEFLYEVDLTVVDDGRKEKNCYSVLVVPFGDREAVALYAVSYERLISEDAEHNNCTFVTGREGRGDCQSCKEECPDYYSDCFAYNACGIFEDEGITDSTGIMYRRSGRIYPRVSNFFCESPVVKAEISSCPPLTASTIERYFQFSETARLIGSGGTKTLFTNSDYTNSHIAKWTAFTELTEDYQYLFYARDEWGGFEVWMDDINGDAQVSVGPYSSVVPASSAIGGSFIGIAHENSHPYGRGGFRTEDRGGSGAS